MQFAFLTSPQADATIQILNKSHHRKVLTKQREEGREGEGRERLTGGEM
jgi:hypothetical protein